MMLYEGEPSVYHIHVLRIDSVEAFESQQGYCESKTSHNIFAFYFMFICDKVCSAQVDLLENRASCMNRAYAQFKNFCGVHQYSYTSRFLKGTVGRIEKRVDLTWKFEQVQLPGLSSLTPVRSSSPPKPLFAASLCLILLFRWVFSCKLLLSHIALYLLFTSPPLRPLWVLACTGGGELLAAWAGDGVRFSSCSDWLLWFWRGGFLQMALGAAGGDRGAWFFSQTICLMDSEWGILIMMKKQFTLWKHRRKMFYSYFISFHLIILLRQILQNLCVFLESQFRSETKQSNLAPPHRQVLPSVLAIPR